MNAKFLTRPKAIALAGIVIGAMAIGGTIGWAITRHSSPTALSTAQKAAKAMPSDKASQFMDGVKDALTSTTRPDNPNAVPSNAPGLTKAEPSGAPATGILTIHQGDFPPTDFTVTTQAAITVDGTHYVVYAGTTGPTGPHGVAPGVGGLRVEDIGGNATVLTGTYTMTGTKSLTLTAITGTALTVKTNTGATGTFDLKTLTFTR